MKIAVASDVLVCAVLRDNEDRAIQAERVLKRAASIAVATPALCEFADALQRTHGLSGSDVAMAIRSLLNAANVVADREAATAGLAFLEAGGTFSEGVVAFEGQRLGANNFVSFAPDSMARVERLMPHYR